MKHYLIIPLGGLGIRFVNSGYKTYKPFLKTSNKSRVIDNIVNNFPKKNTHVIIIGNTKRYSFCSECGSHLFSNIEHENYNEITFIKGGSLDQPTLADITPDLEVFTESKVKWANCGNLGASFPKNPE